MGFKGKKQTKGKKSGLGASLGGFAKSAMGGKSGGGMSSGLYRVTPRGDIIKVSQKRRKKGYRMPKMVAETMRSMIEQNKAISQAVLLSALK